MYKVPFEIHTRDGDFHGVIELTGYKAHPFRLTLELTERATPTEKLEGPIFYFGTLDNIFKLMIGDYRFARSHD